MTINMKVWIATWSVRSQEPGAEVFATRELAVEAAIGYAQEMSLLDGFQMSEDLAHRTLLDSGSLSFPEADCYYEIECHDVIET